MNNKKDRAVTHIKTILKYCQDILDIRAEHDPTYEAFLHDKGYQYSVSFCIEQIGELAKKLRSEGFAEKYPKVQWNEIAGLRNRVAHGYDTIDLEMVFDIATGDIPVLMENCKQILQQETSLAEKIEAADKLQAELGKQNSQAVKNNRLRNLRL